MTGTTEAGVTPEVEPSPRGKTASPPLLHDLSCAVHLHSNYSDGTASIPELMDSAADAGRDVVLLTDHDSLGAKHDGWEGWHGSVLLGVGLEVTPEVGHYLAFGIDEVIDHEGMEESLIPKVVEEAGGFGFIAHPFSKGAAILDRYSWITKRGLHHGWTNLEDEGPVGIELWSLTTDAGESWRGPIEAIRYMLDPEKHLDGPDPAYLRTWDELCSRRRVVAIGGLDAHQHGIQFRGRLWSPMKNARYFRMLSTYASVAEAPSGDGQRDLGLVYDALREGRCYLSVDAIAPGRGFRFWAESGEEVANMGEERPAGEWTLRSSLPRAARTTLLRDGEPVATSESDSLEFHASEPGVYRVEAHLEWRGRERPWIYSNPVYLR